MSIQPEKKSPPLPPRPRPNPFSNSSNWWVLLLLILVLTYVYYSNGHGGRAEISYGLFRRQLEEKNVDKVNVQGAKVYGEFKKAPLDPESKQQLNTKFETTLPPMALSDPSLDRVLREQLKGEYKVSEPTDNTMAVLLVYLLIPVGLLIGVWFLFRRARDSFFTGGLTGGFTKSGARRYDAGERPITFDDVAGLEGVKEDLQEVVEFLRNPAKFQRLARGSPREFCSWGHRARARPCWAGPWPARRASPSSPSTAPSSFRMFVGVGAGRVRDLFNTAKENAPAILFIDEIDAVGRYRGAGVGGGHDEREQTLNQILSEMDGFTPTESVIVMAATNRPDVLDPALLRPGRFDRHITVDRPTMKGRLAIFQVHTRDVPLDADVDLQRLAAGTVGLTGADIRNLVNEAALWASREDKNCVTMSDFEYARDKVLMGSKREEVLLGKEKSMVAYHESGHTLLAWLVPGINRVHKVSIVPRGRALGVTQLLPEEDRMDICESELKTTLLFALGGRAAEKLVFDEYSAGAADDLNKATQLARRMVTQWGMSERLGPVAYRDSEDHPFLGREMAEPRRFSEHTAQVIDEEVSRLLCDAAERATAILTEQREKLDLLAKRLEEAETLNDSEIERLIGPTVNKQGSPTLEIVSHQAPKATP